MPKADLRFRRLAAASALVLSTLIVTGCQSGSSTHTAAPERIKSDPNESFSSKEYGVAASPRVTDAKIVRKGGGRSQVGKPYKVRGKWYYPKAEAPGHSKTGKASWYGSSFHGRLTANGEVYDMFGLSGAHPTLPLPSYAKVTNLKNGASVMVRVNDRGPYAHGRVMDLSSKAADLLGYKQEGIGDIKVEYVGLAPTEGDDTAVLMATYRPATARAIDDGLPTGVMIAMNDTPFRTPGYAAGFADSTTPSLPGVRPLQATSAATGSGPSEGSLVDTDAMSVGSIIARQESPSTVSAPPIPTPRIDPYAMVAASYAPTVPLAGAAGALAAFSAPGSAPAGVSGAAAERIEVGLVTDAAILKEIRALVGTEGRLVVDAGAPDMPGSVSLAVDVASGADTDGLLQGLWALGARDAFVLRD